MEKRAIAVIIIFTAVGRTNDKKRTSSTTSAAGGWGSAAHLSAQISVVKVADFISTYSGLRSSTQNYTSTHEQQFLCILHRRYCLRGWCVCHCCCYFKGAPPFVSAYYFTRLLRIICTSLKCILYALECMIMQHSSEEKHKIK